jgi:MATE family multidrug resistance protein
MLIVDAAMVGHYSSQELAYQSIGLAPMMFLLVTAFGLMNGTLVATAFHSGSGNLGRCGAIWRRSLIYALALGIIGVFISSFGEFFLISTGQTANLARGGGEIISILGWSMPPMLIFVASSFFLEGLKRPKAGMYIMIVGNIANVILNWLWVFGNAGFPELGAAGSALSTVVVRIIMACAIVYHIWHLSDHSALNIRVYANMIYNGGWQAWLTIRRIGFGGGASNAIESGAFSSMSIFAGLLGIIPLSAFTIAFNMLALTFMFALGLGSATAVCVGNAKGRKDKTEMAIAGWTGLTLTLISMMLLGSLLAVFSNHIASGFTNDPQLIVITAPIIAFIGVVLILDGGQSVMAHSLRGCGETWIPATLHVISYIMVMIPLGYYLSLILGRGAMGLFESILIASIVSLSLASVRFYHITKLES